MEGFPYPSLVECRHVDACLNSTGCGPSNERYESYRYIPYASWSLWIEPNEMHRFESVLHSDSIDTRLSYSCQLLNLCDGLRIQQVVWLDMWER